MMRKPTRQIAPLRFWQRLGSVALVPVCVYLGFSISERWKDLEMARDDVRTASSTLAQQVQTENIKQAELETLETSAGVEAVLRERYHMAKEGEFLIVVHDNKKDVLVERVQASIWDSLQNRLWGN
jgi:cell division protein FtsB